MICLEHPAMVGGTQETKILKGDPESPDNAWAERWKGGRSLQSGCSPLEMEDEVLHVEGTKERHFGSEPDSLRLSDVRGGAKIWYVINFKKLSNHEKTQVVWTST